MVITIEPGIYVPAAPQFPKQYHNMGIRIEDEVLVGKKDPIVLSVAAPKEVSGNTWLLTVRFCSYLALDCGRGGRVPGATWVGAVLIYPIVLY